MKNIYSTIRSKRFLQAGSLAACLALSAIASAPLDGHAIGRTIIRSATHVASAALTGQTSPLHCSFWWWLRRY